MKEQNKKQQENTTNGEQWVFVPLLKKLILKRTTDYVLFRVEDGSAIVNGKFLRKKETDDYVFLSIPNDYVVTIRVRDYDEEKQSWFTKKEYMIKAPELKSIMRNYSQEVLNNKDKLPF